MFRGVLDYPNPAELVRVLLGALERLNGHGAVNLTDEEAARLREAGYTAVLGAGWYSVPRISIELLRPHPALHALVVNWYGPKAFDPTTPPPVQSRFRRELTPAERITWRFGQALRNSDIRRLLESFARAPHDGIARRRLQQNLCRLPAARFNPALTALISAGLVVQQNDRRLALDPEARRLLLEGRIGVRRALSARSKRQTREQRRADQARISKRLIQSSKNTVPSNGPRRYQPRRIDARKKDRRWALAMRGRLGGLAAQRSYRERGIDSTAKATAVRLAKRSRQNERRNSANASTAFAPIATVVGPDAAGNVRPSLAAPSIMASRISAALAYQQPIGRRERLTEERNRR